MAVINVLDKNTAELIAAGEVVERPASVVKELVENSIDAGAKNISVEIENGGVKKIVVLDDGSGIDSEYVRTAFIRHATSKIKDGNDLDRISSLGFRGEALPSIASVSRLELITKTDVQDFAVMIKIEGGEETAFDIQPFVNGSKFTVRDLFYNTPARMKFLKKDSTEAGYVQEVLTNLALSRPDISFTFIREGKEIFSTIGDGNLLNTVASLFGTEFSSSLVPVEYADGVYSISGFATSPHRSRQSRNMQYSFINSRFVKNKTIIAAAENAYKGTVMVGKFPGYILDIRMPYDAVDVNVHPAKTEVRFVNESRVFSAVYSAVKSSILQDRSVRKLQINQSGKKQTAPDVKQTNLSESESRESSTGNGDLQFTDDKGDVPTSKADKFVKKYIVNQFESRNEYSKDNLLVKSSPASFSIKQTHKSPQESITYSDADFNNVTQSGSISSENAGYPDLSVKYSSRPSDETLDDINLIGEAFDTYVLFQIGEELIIMDKHAAHERLLYEQLTQDAKFEKQILLSPVPVRLSTAEKLAVTENMAILEKYGFEIDDFGSDGIIVRAIPMYISDDDPSRLMQEIAYNLQRGKKAGMSEKLDWIFHSVACRSAIKAGDKVGRDVLMKLILDIRAKKVPLYCPHGRPVIISISKKELERQFGR